MRRTTKLSLTGMALVSAVWFSWWIILGSVPHIGPFFVVGNWRIHLSFLGPRWWIDILGIGILPYLIGGSVSYIRATMVDARLNRALFESATMFYAFLTAFLYHWSGFFPTAMTAAIATIGIHRFIRQAMIDNEARADRLITLYGSLAYGTGIGIMIKAGGLIGIALICLYALATLVVGLKCYGALGIAYREVSQFVWGWMYRNIVGRTRSFIHSIAE